MEWALTHKNWTIAQWNRVLWSDEKKFCVYNTKRRQHCRRKKGEALRSDTIQGTVKHSPGIMVWGCFGNGKVGDLHKINGTMTAEVYRQILTHHAFPSANRIFNDGDRWTFMQDNDPKHSSNLIKNYLQNKVSHNDRIQLMKWPPQSPDLNPLELLWEECDREVKKRKPSNLTELENVVREVWTTMPAEKINKLIGRLPALCKETLKVEGGYFIEKNVGKKNKRQKLAKQTVY
jgi:transposase